MNPTVFDKQRVLKCKTPITVLALIALLCTALSSIAYFAFYNDDELTFVFPSFLNLISFAMHFAPKVLLILYAVKFFRSFKATIIVPIIFSCIVASPLLSFISTLIGGYELDGITLITNISTIIIFTLATIGALKGLSNKVFIVIPTALGLALNLLSLISVSSNLTFFSRNGFTLYLFTEPMSIIASITFYVALLLLGLKNRIPAILAISPENEKKNTENMTPEQSLRLLNDKLELGLITEKEYQLQRADIIDKL